MAPDFCLADTAGVFRSVDEYRGKYVYLNFVSSYSYTCTQDLEQLKLLNEKTKGVMDVISISIDDDFDQMKNFFKRPAARPVISHTGFSSEFHFNALFRFLFAMFPF